MAIRNFVEVDTVIADVYRDYKDDVEIPKLDMVHWIDDALGLIGVKGQFADLTVILPISNHRGLLPCGFIEEIQLADSGGNAMYPSTGTIMPSSVESLPNDNTLLGQEVETENFPLLVTSTAGCNRNEYYMDDGCIYTSIDSGNIVLNYVGVRVDNDGFPKVPDVEEYKQALKWYIIVKLIEKKWWSGGTNLETKLQYAKAEWKSYMHKAVDQGNMFTLPELENFKNNWVRLVPRSNEFANFYRGLAQPEHRLNNRY